MLLLTKQVQGVRRSWVEMSDPPLTHEACAHFPCTATRAHTHMHSICTHAQWFQPALTFPNDGHCPTFSHWWGALFIGAVTLCVCRLFCVEPSFSSTTLTTRGVCVQRGCITIFIIVLWISVCLRSPRCVLRGGPRVPLCRAAVCTNVSGTCKQLVDGCR